MSRWTFQDDSSLPPPPTFKGGSKNYLSGSTKGTEIYFDLISDLSSSPSTSKFQTNSSETANSSESFEQVNHSAIEQPNEVTNSTDQNYNSTHYSQDSSGNESESKQVNENGYPNEPSSQYSSPLSYSTGPTAPKPSVRKPPPPIPKKRPQALTSNQNNTSSSAPSTQSTSTTLLSPKRKPPPLPTTRPARYSDHITTPINSRQDESVNSRSNASPNFQTIGNPSTTPPSSTFTPKKAPTKSTVLLPQKPPPRPPPLHFSNTSSPSKNPTSIVPKNQTSLNDTATKGPPSSSTKISALSGLKKAPTSKGPAPPPPKTTGASTSGVKKAPPPRPPKKASWNVIS